MVGNRTFIGMVLIHFTDWTFWWEKPDMYRQMCYPVQIRAEREDEWRELGECRIWNPSSPPAQLPMFVRFGQIKGLSILKSHDMG